MTRLIERKRCGDDLDPGLWKDIVASYVADTVGDAQMAALCMSVMWRGMSASEIEELTTALLESGARIRFRSGPIIDKHSTGGVADVVSLIAVPLAAACGARVAKLSGRALAHTGGTVDKLEAIPGFVTGLDRDRFVRVVEEVGCAIASQTADMVPADKKLYALRDLTATVPSVGLIASSIVSKKIAGGADTFVFDVKIGAGAFMKDEVTALALAQVLVDTSVALGYSARAILSNMDEPLGRAIGTGLEVIEARDFLRGDARDPRVHDLCKTVVREMLNASAMPNADSLIEDALRTGAAYAKFVEMVEAQGSSRSAVESMHPHGVRRVAQSKTAGFVRKIDVVKLGTLGRQLSVSDSQAGVRVAVRVGDEVDVASTLATLYGGAEAERIALESAFTVGAEAPSRAPLVYRFVPPR